MLFRQTSFASIAFYKERCTIHTTCKNIKVNSFKQLKEIGGGGGSVGRVGLEVKELKSKFSGNYRGVFFSPVFHILLDKINQSWNS